MLIHQLVEAELESLDVFLARYEFNLQDIQSDVFDEVLAALQRLPQDDGSFVISDRAKAVILRLEEKILNIIDSGKYQKQYSALVKNFATIEAIRKEVSLALNPALKREIYKANTTPIRNAFMNRVSQTLGNKDTFGFNVVTPIKDILLEASTVGMTVKQATRRLFDLAMGSQPGGGVLARYAGQVAHDSLFGFTGSVDQAIGDFIGAKDVNYLGGIVKESRPQCVRWVEKFGGFIPEKELAAEIQWAKEHGQGYSKHLPELTVKTFAIVKGGHRCRHKVVYSKGSAKGTLNEIEKEYRKQSDKLNNTIYKDLDEKTKALYDKSKQRVDNSIRLYGR
jgi:hypothetical protein